MWLLHLFFFHKHGLFLGEPGKEIEIATNKLTTMCLKYWWFQPEHAYKAVAYKKKKVWCISTCITHQIGCARYYLSLHISQLTHQISWSRNRGRPHTSHLRLARPEIIRVYTCVTSKSRFHYKLYDIQFNHHFYLIGL